MNLDQGGSGAFGGGDGAGFADLARVGGQFLIADGLVADGAQQSVGLRPRRRPGGFAEFGVPVADDRLGEVTESVVAEGGQGVSVEQGHVQGCGAGLRSVRPASQPAA